MKKNYNDDRWRKKKGAYLDVGKEGILRHLIQKRR